MGVPFSQQDAVHVSSFRQELEAKKKDVLNLNTTLHGISELFVSKKVKNVIIMTGAGISVSAGIPDFRSPHTGLYDLLASFSIPYREAVFSIDFFKRCPEPFYMILSRYLYAEYHPTLAHFFIKLLYKKDLLLRCYTQNVDNLDLLAGLPQTSLVHAHGTLLSTSCIDCGRKFPLSPFRQLLARKLKVIRCHTLREFMKNACGLDQEPVLQTDVSKNFEESFDADQCMGLVKPDIVFFGEQLPEHFFKMVQEDFHRADLLIILGTSATVQPFAQLIDMVPKLCPRLLINKEPVGIFGSQHYGFQFQNANNYRDVFHQSECDDGVMQLCALSGYEQELKQLASSYVKLSGKDYWTYLEELKPSL